MAHSAAFTWNAGNGWTGEYRGQIEDGRPHGFGVLTDDKRGDEYQGHFAAGKFDGKGTAVYDQLDTYDGEWKNGKHHGHGVRSYDYGSSRYDGQWQDGQKHGYGIYSYADGNVKCGQWEEDDLIAELPKAEVMTALHASKQDAARALAARACDYDAGLFEALKSPKYRSHGQLAGNLKQLTPQRPGRLGRN